MQIRSLAFLLSLPVKEAVLRTLEVACLAPVPLLCAPLCIELPSRAAARHLVPACWHIRAVLP